MQSKKIEEIDKNFIIPTNGSERFTYFNIADEVIKLYEACNDTSKEIRQNNTIERFHISGFPWLKSNVSTLSSIFAKASDENHKNPNITISLMKQ